MPRTRDGLKSPLGRARTDGCRWLDAGNVTMPDEEVTRCSGCRTIFRVTAQQLEMRGGQGRCGHCRTVFDGVEALVSLAPQPDQEPELDEISRGPPTVTLRNAQALQPAPGSDDQDSQINDGRDERDELAAER